MSEKTFNVSQNGQALIQSDVNTIGSVAGLAGDRVYAELFRMTPYNGTTATRAVLPYGHQTSARTSLVTKSGNDGKVLVNPFRAFVSSRTSVGADAQANWRDVRSGLSVAEGATALTQSVTLAANSSGNPRWDVVCAVLTLDSASSTVSRKQKDPTTRTIANVSVSLTTIDTVTVAAFTGTAAASPTWASSTALIPADTTTVFYIPLAYVRVPNGFNGTSAVSDTDIAEVASCLTISPVTGGASLELANNSRFSTLSTSQQQAWGTGTRPSAWLPNTMVGGESLIIPVDLRTGSESHSDLAVLDTRDWRNRLCRFYVTTQSGSNSAFAWTGIGQQCPIASLSQTTNSDGSNASSWGLSNTFNRAGDLPVAFIDGVYASAFMSSSAQVGIYCSSSTGQLYLHIPMGTPNAAFFFWLDFSAPFGNAF